jgi:hypothetical protein
MNDTARRTALGLLLLGAGATVRAQMHNIEDATDISVSGKTPESIIISWPTYSYRLARMMIAKYGQPTEAGEKRLVWDDNGPWKRTVVYREDPTGRVFKRSRGRLEQSAAYRVTADKLDALARFDKELEADVDAGRLIVRSDSESENFLALNLADEVIKGRRSPKDASELREKLSHLQRSGKASSYTDGLLFVRKDQFANPESPD